ncbi:MAG TPA: patatin-like phospholipase family protein [Trueperaceae bacterium]|nr:patatin-like phospholipase family protein [Trueperaceae bacterium]
MARWAPRLTNRDGRPQVGLVLSGGGARCYAQVGALKALEEAGFAVAAIAANSSAAILGAIYASCGDARQLEAVTLDIDFSSFLDLDGSTGLFGHEGVKELLGKHAKATFEELEIPLAVPAVDIERAELLIFNKGPIVPPVCASNAFPGLFTPVEYLGRNLMDGGIVNNFPVDIIRSMTSRPVLAIDTRPSPTAPLDLGGATPSTLLGKLGALFSQGVPTTVDILTQAYNITQARVVEITCALHPPDLRLVSDLPHDLDIQSFSRIEEALEIGYVCVKEAVAAGRFEVLTLGD